MYNMYRIILIYIYIDNVICSIYIYMHALCVYNMHYVWILMAWETHGNPTTSRCTNTSVYSQWIHIHHYVESLLNNPTFVDPTIIPLIPSTAVSSLRPAFGGWLYTRDHFLPYGLRWKLYCLFNLQRGCLDIGTVQIGICIFNHLEISGGCLFLLASGWCTHFYHRPTWLVKHD